MSCPEQLQQSSLSTPNFLIQTTAPLLVSCTRLSEDQGCSHRDQPVNCEWLEKQKQVFKKIAMSKLLSSARSTSLHQHAEQRSATPAGRSVYSTSCWRQNVSFSPEASWRRTDATIASVTLSLHEIVLLLKSAHIGLSVASPNHSYMVNIWHIPIS